MPRNPKRHELQQRDFRVKHGIEPEKKPRIILPERHLFVTEGTKTEPNYLCGLVYLICERFGPLAKRQFDIIGEGDNTMKRCDAINKRFQSEGRDTMFHAIWSNQCVELWFVLHFNYLQSDIDRSQYRDTLSRHIGRHYEKNDDEIFKILHPKLNQAIRNAKRLMSNYSVELPPFQKAPATNMYELVEYLREYIE